MNETNWDTMFGKMAVEQGLCTDAELRHCLEELTARSKINPVMLYDLMVNLGYITATQAERLKANLKASKSTVTHQIPGYKVLGKLGSGAMAIVYKGQQLSLNRRVAIKVLPKRFSENPEYVERFYKEGQAAGKLNHNNIVQAFDVGEAGGYHYFVMEYVEGKTIYDDIAAGNVFAEDEAIEIIIQVAHALAHAHARGLIHRDVKPKNIMINTAGVVKLADMGLARETTDIEAAQTEKGKAYGTPYYIAPEQIRGEVDIDGRADIYGLG
ncbi:MAG: serine/threonine protein kinase [Planctomycetota bacterium]